MAHSAFSKAQACDPTHIEGWIGDGLVAEAIGKQDEARNFFQISSELGYHVRMLINMVLLCYTLVHLHICVCILARISRWMCSVGVSLLVNI